MKKNEYRQLIVLALVLIAVATATFVFIKPPTYQPQQGKLISVDIIYGSNSVVFQSQKPIPDGYTVHIWSVVDPSPSRPPEFAQHPQDEAYAHIDSFTGSEQVSAKIEVPYTHYQLICEKTTSKPAFHFTFDSSYQQEPPNDNIITHTIPCK